MPAALDPEIRRALAERIRYYHELGIYDFYRRGSVAAHVTDALQPSDPDPETREEMPARKSAVVAKPSAENLLQVLTSNLEQGVTDPIAALKLIREDLGDCTR